MKLCQSAEPSEGLLCGKKLKYKIIYRCSPFTENDIKNAAFYHLPHTNAATMWDNIIQPWNLHCNFPSGYCPTSKLWASRYIKQTEFIQLWRKEKNRVFQNFLGVFNPTRGLSTQLISMNLTTKIMICHIGDRSMVAFVNLS